MTAKRFSVKQRQGATNYSIEDYYGELPLSEGMYYKSNADKLCKWLNTQHELLNALYNENEELKTTIQQLTNDNTKQKKKLNTTMKENEHIKTTIKDMINTERTEIGQSVLRQLWEAIQ